MLGLNLLEEVLILYGQQGRNGKGIILDLLGNMLGDKYYKNLPLKYIIKDSYDKHSQSAEPELADIMNARIIVVDEASSDSLKGVTILKSAALKKLSGNSTIQARKLYENGVSFVPQGELVIVTNDKPQWDSTDDAFKERMKFCPLRRRFVSNPNPENPNEFPADRNLKSKFKEVEYRLAFFHILFSYFLDLNISRENGQIKIDMPESFIKDNEEFVEENDPIKEFINAKIEVTESETDRIRSSDLFKYYTDYHGSNRGINANKFKIILETKYGFKHQRLKEARYFTNIIKRTNFDAEEI